MCVCVARYEVETIRVKLVEVSKIGLWERSWEFYSAESVAERMVLIGSVLSIVSPTTHYVTQGNFM